MYQFGAIGHPHLGGHQDTSARVCPSGVDRGEEQDQREDDPRQTDAPTKTQLSDNGPERAHRKKITNLARRGLSIAVAYPLLRVVLNVAGDHCAVYPVNDN